MNKSLLSLLGIFIFSSVFFLLSPKQAHANIFDDIVNGVKSVFTPSQPKQLSVTSKITLAPDGDANKNGQIDAGDTVTFAYTVTNLTETDYKFATLKTNINRNQINFVHNVKGTASLNDDGKTITIPNFNIAANQVKTITFDARINYSAGEDPIIATEADFLSHDKKSIAKAIKQELKAKRMTEDQILGSVKQVINKESN